MAFVCWYDVDMNQRKYLSQSLPSLILFSDTDEEDDEDYETSEEDEIDGPGSQENGQSSPYFNCKFAPISSTWKNNKVEAWGEEHVEDTGVYTHSPVPDIRIIEESSENAVSISIITSTCNLLCYITSTCNLLCYITSTCNLLCNITSTCNLLCNITSTCNLM